jgi:hypothetical protein
VLQGWLQQVQVILSYAVASMQLQSATRAAGKHICITASVFFFADLLPVKRLNKYS